MAKTGRRETKRTAQTAELSEGQLEQVQGGAFILPYIEQENIYKTNTKQLTDINDGTSNTFFVGER